tara:strand:- start:402 stop:584 length:183 start_codon:yes stop_codon:yes gene_type:complete
VETQKERPVITKELRVDNVGLYEATFVNNKVVMIKDINGCTVIDNEVLLEYVENRKKKNK